MAQGGYAIRSAGLAPRRQAASVETMSKQTPHTARHHHPAPDITYTSTDLTRCVCRAVTGSAAGEDRRERKDTQLRVRVARVRANRSCP